ncbi:MAG: UDP-2,3-diacylglucosamine diphosphatase [Rudaea sp.]|nr:UDP-2,3-diacylglucosamine diphosphatase [Rudaea sp.]
MSRQRFRSIFISDIHLGLRDCQAAYLLDFLRASTCERLYLVGDIIDLENLERRPWWHGDHGAVLAEFFAIAARGTHVTYIPGNHDAALRRFAGQRFAGIDIALEAVHVGADGRRYRVSHGDEFDSGHRAPVWLMRVGDFLQGFVCTANRRVNSLLRRLGLRYRPLSIAIKLRIAAARRFIREFETRVASAARDDGFDGHICGHIHYGRIENHTGVLYLNDGDWVEHCTALVEHMDGTLELLHWTGQQRRLGLTQALASPALPAAA